MKQIGNLLQKIKHYFGNIFNYILKKRRIIFWVLLFFGVPLLFSFLIFPHPWEKTHAVSTRNEGDSNIVIEASIPKSPWEVFLTEVLSIPLNLKYVNIFVENNSFIKDCEPEKQMSVCVLVEEEEFKKYHQNCIWEEFKMDNGGVMGCFGGFIVQFQKNVPSDI